MNLQNRFQLDSSENSVVASYVKQTSYNILVQIIYNKHKSIFLRMKKNGFGFIW